MKKITSLLAIFTLSASLTSGVIACSGNGSNKLDYNPWNLSTWNNKQKDVIATKFVASVNQEVSKNWYDTNSIPKPSETYKINKNPLWGNWNYNQPKYDVDFSGSPIGSKDTINQLMSTYNKSINNQNALISFENKDKTTKFDNKKSLKYYFHEGFYISINASNVATGSNLTGELSIFIQGEIKPVVKSFAQEFKNYIDKKTKPILLVRDYSITTSLVNDYKT